MENDFFDPIDLVIILVIIFIGCFMLFGIHSVFSNAQKN